MNLRCALGCLATVATVGLGLPSHARGQAPAPPVDLLRAAAAYLLDYERQVSMVVAEESYNQISRGGGSAVLDSRVLKSDFLVVNGGIAGWFGFRDVFEVDGHAVRDHQDRLLKLVTSPSPDPLEQMKRMADEGARYNIGGITRTINLPTLALLFLRGPEQDRSTWTRGNSRRINGKEVVELRFAEHAMPRVIASRDDAAATGRFWIEPESGRIVRSELLIDSMGVSGSVTVTFGPAPKIEPWVPLSMDESYRWTRGSQETMAVQSGGATRDAPVTIRPSGDIDGHATYKNFRTFSVASNTIIK
jgi:hypothetical protein